MKPRKTKSSEPSARDKLSASFMKAFQNDFETHGIETIEKLREESPAKYAEIAAKLIAAAEPKADGFESCQSNREIAIKLLKSVGADEFELTEEAIAEAMEANDRFVNRLKEIRAEAEGQLQ
jgi:hypothetical protein